MKMAGCRRIRVRIRILGLMYDDVVVRATTPRSRRPRTWWARSSFSARVAALVYIVWQTVCECGLPKG